MREEVRVTVKRKVVIMTNQILKKLTPNLHLQGTLVVMEKRLIMGKIMKMMALKMATRK